MPLLTRRGERKGTRSVRGLPFHREGVPARTAGDGGRGAVRPAEPLGRREAILPASPWNEAAPTPEDVSPAPVQPSTALRLPFQVPPHAHLSSPSSASPFGPPSPPPRSQKSCGWGRPTQGTTALRASGRSGFCTRNQPGLGMQVPRDTLSRLHGSGLCPVRSLHGPRHTPAEH